MYSRLIAKTIPPPPPFSDEDLPTVEAVVAQKRREAEARSQKSLTAPEPSSAMLSSETSPSAPAKDVESHAHAPPPEGSPEALEEEAGQQGAFNPETGEINWDCPCLGGMAHGPCGEEFKAAFSCFVYSKEEPKGMDCIDKFQYVVLFASRIIPTPKLTNNIDTCKTASGFTLKCTETS